MPKLPDDEVGGNVDLDTTSDDGGDEAAYDSSHFASSSRAKDIRAQRDKDRSHTAKEHEGAAGRSRSSDDNSPPLGSKEETPRIESVDMALLNIPEHDMTDSNLIVPEPGSSLGLALGPLAAAPDESLRPLETTLPRLEVSIEGDTTVMSPYADEDPTKPIELVETSDSSDGAKLVLSDKLRARIRAEEDRYRQLAWEAVRDELEYYAEKVGRPIQWF